MTWWQALVVAFVSGVLGTILGAQLQARRERKAAVRTSAIQEVTEFSDAAAQWLQRVQTAIQARDSMSPDDDAAFRAADEAVRDGWRLLARLLPIVGGPTSPVGRDAVNVVACLDAAIAEIREWPPDERATGDDGGDEDELADLSEEQRERLDTDVWTDSWEGGIAEATMWAGYASHAFGSFASTAARHIDPTARDRVRAASDASQHVSHALRHPLRAWKRRTRS
jgi:hypothetical protein